MHLIHTAQFRCQCKPVIASSLAIALLTLISYELRLNEATVVLLYLIVVILQSMTGSFVPAAIVGLIVAACLDFFFLPPLLSFRIADPRNILALFVFLIASLVVTRLVARARCGS
jgi:two-component system sensor histidine kinase KdpD